MLRWKIEFGEESVDVPLQVTGMVVPLPTVIPEGGGGRWERSIPSDDDMWAVALVSRTQGEGPWRDIWFRAATRPA